MNPRVVSDPAGGEVLVSCLYQNTIGLLAMRGTVVNFHSLQPVRIGMRALGLVHSHAGFHSTLEAPRVRPSKVPGDVINSPISRRHIPRLLEEGETRS